MRRQKPAVGIVIPLIGALFLVIAAGAAAAEEPRVFSPRGVGEGTPFVNTGLVGGRLSFEFRQTPVRQVCDYIAKAADVNVIVAPDIDDVVDVRVLGETPGGALRRVARSFGGAVQRRDHRVFRVNKPRKVDMELVDADLRTVIKNMAKLGGGNVVLSADVEGTVNVRLRDVSWREGLETVVRVGGGVLVEEDSGILRVVTPASLVSQRQTKVFPLRYIQSPDIYRAQIDTEFAVGGPEGDSGVRAYGGSGGKEGVGAAGRRKEKPFTLINAVQSMLSAVGTVDYDAPSNTFVITDIKPKLDRVADFLRIVDTRPDQVFVDVKFVSTTSTDLTDFGMDYVGNFAGATPNDGFRISATGGSVATVLPFNRGRGGWEDWLGIVDDGPPEVSFDPATGAITPAGTIIGGPGYQVGTIDLNQFAFLLQMFKQDLYTDIIQSPKLITLDHQEATIFVGRTVRYAETFSETNAAGGVETGIREASGSPVETGFQLFFIPHVIKGTDLIRIDVIPEEEALTGTGTIPGFDDFTAGTTTIQLPRVASRTIVTSLIVKDGQTVVLGGMVDERETVSERKIPFLGDLPGVGYLFKNRLTNKSRDNLLIFMTCTVVRDRNDMDRIHTVHRDYEAGVLNDVEAAAARNRVNAQ